MPITKQILHNDYVPDDEKLPGRRISSGMGITIDDIKRELNIPELMVKVIRRVDSISIAGNSSSNVTFNVDESGYTPIGVVGFSCSNAYMLNIHRFYIVSGQAVIGLHNITSTQVEISDLAVNVLYVKNGTASRMYGLTINDVDTMLEHEKAVKYAETDIMG